MRFEIRGFGCCRLSYAGLVIVNSLCRWLLGNRDWSTVMPAISSALLGCDGGILNMLPSIFARSRTSPAQLPWQRRLLPTNDGKEVFATEWLFAQSLSSTACASPLPPVAQNRSPLLISNPKDSLPTASGDLAPIVILLPGVGESLLHHWVTKAAFQLPHFSPAFRSLAILLISLLRAESHN